MLARSNCKKNRDKLVDIEKACTLYIGGNEKKPVTKSISLGNLNVRNGLVCMCYGSASQPMGQSVFQISWYTKAIRLYLILSQNTHEARDIPHLFGLSILAGNAIRTAA